MADLRLKRFGIFVLVLSICTFGAFASAGATIINVPGDQSTIQAGIDAATDGDTVLVAEGDYAENINFDGKDIVVGSQFVTTYDSSYILSTTIDGGAAGTVVTFENGESNDAMLVGFTITNGNTSEDGGGIACINSSPTIDHNFITGNRVSSNQTGKGGGIYCSGSSARISNSMISGNNVNGNLGGSGGGIYLDNSDVVLFICRITGNTAQWSGGGIYMDQSDPVLRSVNLINNSASLVGGGLACYGSNPAIINVGFYSNRVTLNQGAAIYSGSGSGVDVINSILWNNGQPAVYLSNADVTFDYSNVQDSLWPGDGNISEDPLNRDPNTGDFHLMATECGDPNDSPCIDAGDPNILENRMDCDWGIGDERSDMGAYGGVWDTTTSVFDPPSTLPEKVSLIQNYPNPFNASTTIIYNLPVNSDVQLEVYNLLGQKVATLVDGYQEAGYNAVRWDASSYTSGVYFYKLTVGNDTDTRRMVLLK
ncbi:MAG: T9SS type A sorting domain-containing protein [candidate division Zixibacteria bacterium]|nr:T9SS type A sorting domain-containing protein [candidate division Zixibacteria bacterium]